jgi:hypothetical protein
MAFWVKSNIITYQRSAWESTWPDRHLNPQENCQLMQSQNDMYPDRLS